MRGATMVDTGELARLMARAGAPFDAIDDVDLAPLLARIGDARVVLLGEATHGTAEFYRLRARITRALVEARGFRIVAAEADWPDAARLDAWIRGRAADGEPAFQRFPTWMWRNVEVLALLERLRAFNAHRDESDRVGFYGLDLYSLHRSIRAVLDYLDDVDPDAAGLARARYGCLLPWRDDPAIYGQAVLVRGFAECEEAVVTMLRELLARRVQYASADGSRFFDAVQNARLVANAERYYRVMYHGARQSWNLRDQHMFDTLEALLRFHGEGSRAVVWAHNSHVGDAAATEMGRGGETNIGRLCRQRFGRAVYIVGFGTDHGTVLAADDWDDAGEVMRVRPARADSYEGAAHESGVARFFLPLRDARDAELRDALLQPRLERAIGVIYRPATERISHYFESHLPLQFDDWAWFDESSAVEPLAGAPAPGEPETFPFGL